MTEAAAAAASVAVVIPTRSRPQLLRRCLDSLAPAQGRLGFPAYVCDSSPGREERGAVREICSSYPWVRLCPHDGANVAAARNTGARAAREELLVDVDDDLILEPEAIDRLVRRYDEGHGRRVVAGSVAINGTWSAPVKKRRIGYGRPVLEGEEPDFVIGALFLYPRSFAVAWPWNERIDTADDIFMGALWRSHGVRILFEPEARAAHPDVPLSFDPDRLAETVKHQSWHIYSLLFDALIANPNPLRALAYEVLGFLASAKVYLRRPTLAIPFLRSWARGHRRLLADRRYLRQLVRKELPADGA
ncbi:MAG TPA: glycosyltransferase family A protein [Solirubrobacterales bacterium]|nr:glycosyltransferase family A protein [Solirubrobacterales bacterium]